MLFANSFWSADYVSGIERLSTQLRLSIAQLHELRTVVFSYMKCFHGSGEALSQLWASGYPHDSSYRVSRGKRSDRRDSRRSERMAHRRVISRGSALAGSDGPQLPLPLESSGASQVLSYDVQDLTWDLDFVFRRCVNDANLHLGHFQRLASAIDESVLVPLTAFLKLHEPLVLSALRDLDSAYSSYCSAYTAVDALRLQYTTTSRLGDFPADRGTGSDLEGSAQDTQTPSLGRRDLEFPLVVPGVIEFETRADLAVFLQNIFLSVPITKRKISIPGYSNDIFSAEHLCDLFIRKRPKGFNPTRSNTEKLGQALLDWKLIVGTGFFAKKFILGNMWFQWSDLAVQLTLNSDSALADEFRPVHKGAADTQTEPKRASDAPIKYLDDTMSHLSLSTTKKLNGVLKTMRTFGKHQYSEQELLDLEQEYNESYNTFSSQKHLLETQIFTTALKMQRFERAKINLIYHSLATLQELLKTHFEKAAQTARDNFTQFQNYNTPESHLAELEKTTAHFSLGIYFPSLLVPEPSSSSRPVATSSIQNIKLNFNLFKDVALQLKSDNPAPRLRSTPLFLFEAVNLLEKHPPKLIAQQWMEPINLEMYWESKNSIVSLIQSFELESAVNVQNEAAVEARIIAECIQSLSRLEPLRQVNFIKNWLLEISDSVIPSTVYDSLISVYKLKNDTTMSDTTRILGTIPRGNLSSLVFLLEHISRIFEASNTETIGGAQELNSGDTALESRSEESESKKKEAEPKNNGENSGTKEPESVTGLKDAGGFPEPLVQEIAFALNLMDAIGSIPFVHIIMRPSVVKHKSGFKPPIEEYNMLLSNLLQADCRQELLQALLANEEQYNQRQEQQRQALELQKRNLALQREQQTRERPESGTFPHLAFTPADGDEKAPESGARSSENDGLKPDNFSLRPFRTGTTPRASPTTSPVNRARSRSIDFMALPKTIITPLDLNLEES